MVEGGERGGKNFEWLLNESECQFFSSLPNNVDSIGNLWGEELKSMQGEGGSIQVTKMKGRFEQN